jgi:hypothetical protein
MTSGVLLVLPWYLVLGVFIGLGLGKASTVGEALGIGALAAFVVGIGVGLWDWGTNEEQKGEKADQGASGKGRKGNGARDKGGST